MLATSDPPWFVLLIGGPSGSGKTSVAQELSKQLEVPYFQLDDLRLAIVRMGLTAPRTGLPDGGLMEPDSLIDAGRFFEPAVEVVVENHVDQKSPVIVEADFILPSLFDSPSVLARAGGGQVRAVFLYEPSEAGLLANIDARDRGRTDAAYGQKNFRFGLWLRDEASFRGLPVLESHPWETLGQRTLAATEIEATL